MYVQYSYSNMVTLIYNLLLTNHTCEDYCHLRSYGQASLVFWRLAVGLAGHAEEDASCCADEYCQGGPEVVRHQGTLLPLMSLL